MLDRETIHKLSMLSRIQTTPEEQDALTNDLSNILSYVAQLESVDTEGIPPCNQVLREHKHLMRDDAPLNTLTREDFLKNAPDQVGGMIRVPTVIKKN